MKDTAQEGPNRQVAAVALLIWQLRADHDEAAGAPDGCKDTGKVNYRVAAPDVNQDTGKVTQALQDAAGLHKPFSGSVPGYWVKGGSDPVWKAGRTTTIQEGQDCPSLCCSEVSLRNSGPYLTWHYLTRSSRRYR